MKSRTSFFNLTAFRKNITRFAPVWALYTVFLLLLLFGISGNEQASMARNVLAIMQLAGVGNLIYAGIVAMCLFGDLYKTRLCSALHAFPMRREGWLLTNIASGFLFSIVPNILVCTIASVMMGEFGDYIWHLLAVASLQYVFFFGTAVLAAICAGNRLGMLAIYSIIHFIVVLIYFLAVVIYQPLIYGIELQTESFYQFFPLHRMTGDYVITRDGFSAPEFVGYATENWVHLAICTAVGVVCFVLAWLVYRRRQLERAGDLIALRPLSPVFLVIAAVALGAVFYTFSDLVGAPTYVLYAAGIIIGYFAGRMLLERTVRVFHKRSLLGFGLLGLVIVGSMGLTYLDPLGIGSYVPPLDKVESAVIYGPDKYYVGLGRYDYNTFELTDREEIQRLQRFHKQLLESGPAGSDNYDVNIRYNLTDGSEVNRYYQIDFNGPLTEEANVWFGDPRYIFQVEDTDMLYELIGSFNVYKTNLDPESPTPNYMSSKDQTQLKELLDAILADCAEGKMTQSWIFHRGETSVYRVGFTISDNLPEVYKYRLVLSGLQIYSDCTNTVAYLDALYAANESELTYGYK